jgi:hypothetical protein
MVPLSTHVVMQRLKPQREHTTLWPEFITAFLPKPIGRRSNMADILHFQTEADAFYRRFVTEHLHERRTQDIIDDLKPLHLLGDEDAIARGVLFAELAVKAERNCP